MEEKSQDATANVTPQYVGVDVSKDHLDVAFEPDGEVKRFANKGTGWAALRKRLVALPGAWAVVEATGGYEQRLVEALQAADIAVSRVHPKRVRDFAKSTGLLAKTDALDARILLRFAQVMTPQRLTPESDAQRQLRALLRRRDQLVTHKSQEMQRLHQSFEAAVTESIERSIAWLSKQITELEADIASLQHDAPELAARTKCMRTVPGVGPTISAGLQAELPMLGDPNVSAKQLSALAGLAPYNVDSGRIRKPRHIQAGRARARRYLYNAALVAARHNPVIRDFYQRLLSRGSAKVKALVACARKLLTILHAMLKSHSDWILPQS